VKGKVDSSTPVKPVHQDPHASDLTGKALKRAYENALRSRANISLAALAIGGTVRPHLFVTIDRTPVSEKSMFASSDRTGRREPGESLTTVTGRAHDPGAVERVADGRRGGDGQ